MCSRRVADLSEFWRGQKEITLLDPNLLACSDHEKILLELADSGATVDFNQGLDIRLVTNENLPLIDAVKTKRIHFAWDHAKQDLTENFRFYAENTRRKGYGCKSVYVLTNYNSTQAEDLYRIYTLRDLGYSPYLMIYDKEHAPHELKRMQRWCNNVIIFRSCPKFEDYNERKNT